MKTKSIIFALIILLFNSCLVKSLNPFYTKDVVSFDSSLLGTWSSKGSNKWIIEDLKDKVLRENNVNSVEELNDANKKMYEEFKGAYFVSITEGSAESYFLVVPFKIDDQLFLDFSPFTVESDLSSLTQSHLLNAHSLVKLDVLNDGKVRLNWFDEDRIKDLFKQNKIKIKHQKIRGSLFEEQILLTAKPKELQKFIRKYMASNNEEKWKTDTKYTLTRDLTTP
jgi:hypothetical protein